MASKITTVRRGVWRFTWREGGTRDGVQRTLTIKTTLDDAKRAKRLVEASGHRMSKEEVLTALVGVPAPQTRRSGRVTFGHALESYWGSCTDQRPATMRRLRSQARTCFPAWLDQPLDGITEDAVRTWMRGLRVQPRNPYMLFRAVLRHARDEGWLTTLPTDAIPLPPVGKSPARFLDEDEKAMILAAAGTERNRLLIRVGLDAGLREAEVSTLRVTDLQRRHGRDFLHVTGGATAGETQRWVPGDGKNRYAERTIVIPPELADDLRAYARGHRSGWLFPSPRGKAFTTPSAIGRIFSRTVVRAQAMGLLGSVRFHDLRHTHASDLLNDGVPLLVVSRRLGHGSVKITGDTYGHIDPRSDDLILGALAPKKRGRALRAV